MIYRRFSLVGAALALMASYACHRGEARDGDVGTSDLTSEADAAPLFPVDRMIERAKARSYWPDGAHDWQALDEDAQARLMSSNAACSDFASFMFPAADADQRTAERLGTSVGKLKDVDQALRTDGVIVVKGGTILYEHYVGPYAGHPEKRHCMWSATKSFTTGVMGAIAYSSERAAAGDTSAPFGKLTRDGKAIGLATSLAEIAPATDARLANLTVEDLLSMNIPDPAWNEGYDGNIATSSVVKMLWTDGARDMGQFVATALSKPQGPSSVAGPSAFRYSSGTAVALFRALKDLYGSDYDKLPFGVLFDRLGMKSTVLERDQKGVFVGSSYAHMTLRDMARFGYAYLNGGYYAGSQVIAPSFIEKARVVGAGMRAPETSDEAIEEEGSFYSLGFWINPSPRVLEREGVRAFGETFPKNATNGLLPGSKFFPSTPVDVFFAAGHYGQNIIIFPKDDLMIVRMSHDNEYFSKLDKMMSGARRCFLGSAVAEGGVR